VPLIFNYLARYSVRASHRALNTGMNDHSF
jgi:hypothetical protein